MQLLSLNLRDFISSTWSYFLKGILKTNHKTNINPRGNFFSHCTVWYQFKYEETFASNMKLTVSFIKPQERNGCTKIILSYSHRISLVECVTSEKGSIDGVCLLQ